MDYVQDISRGSLRPPQQGQPPPCPVSQAWGSGALFGSGRARCPPHPEQIHSLGMRVPFSTRLFATCPQSGHAIA